MEVRAFVDTNWLVAAYFPLLDPSRSATTARFSEKWDAPWLISAAVHLECENVFRFIGGHALSPEWVDLQGDLGTAVIQTEHSWETITSKAKELIQRFSPKAKIGTLDTVILASALMSEATHFLSFDTNSNARALAAVLKLKVFPELTAEDKRRMAIFR